MIGNRTLAVPGPTNVPNRISQSMYIPTEDHRAPDLPSFVKPLMEDLKKVFKTETGSVVVFPGTGTGGWQAGLENLLHKGDRVLVSQFGQFSKLWVQMCQDMDLAVHDISVEWGEATPIDRYREILEGDTYKMIKAVMVCQNETATGVTSDVRAVRNLLDELDHPALLMVDGISSIGCIEYRHDEWRVDVAIAGSQKGFMMPTGLVVVALSERVVKIIKGGKWKSKMKYYDFGTMITSNETGYFPYTPAMTLMRGLRTGTDMLLEEGMENVWARHRRLASGVRAAVDAWGLTIAAKDPSTASDTVTSIVVDRQTDANDVILHAYNEYGISLGAGLGPLNGSVFRIGHLGWLNETMVLGVLGGVELAMRDLNVPFQAGAGVGAAISAYSSAKDNVHKLY
jgi:alanine-glyoxylate transaminase/serine-glyoxylate transaminase/serine-pyruvate transaminase